MKKRTIILCSVLVVLVVAIVLVLVLTRGKNNIMTIYMDINPSLEIKINNKEEVVDVIALNDDAKTLIDKEYKGLSLNNAIKEIVNAAVDKEFVKEDEVQVTLASENYKNDDVLKRDIEKYFDERGIKSEVLVQKITEEDIVKAKEYNVSPAKVSYVNEVLEDMPESNFEELVNMSVSEVTYEREVYTSEYYCEEGRLEGTRCVKEVKVEDPIVSNVCPNGYEDINGKCYKTGETTDEEYCNNGFTLSDGKCNGTEKVNATAKCTSGTLTKDGTKCEVLTYVKDLVKKCREEDDLLLSNGKCASHHMGAHFGEPDAVINPATECCCGDTYQNGWCYSLPNGNYNATITCPSGSVRRTGDKGDACYSVKTSTPTYSCSKGTLDGNKCIVDKTVDPEHRPSCTGTLSLYQDRVCVNYEETGEYITGKTCKSKDAELKNDKCITYERTDALLKSVTVE